MYVYVIYFIYYKSIVLFLKICKSKFFFYFNISIVNIFTFSFFFVLVILFLYFGILNYLMNIVL